LIISDNQVETCLIITINDTSICDLKNQPKRLLSDNHINLSWFIVNIDGEQLRDFYHNYTNSIYNRWRQNFGKLQMHCSEFHQCPRLRALAVSHRKTLETDHPEKSALSVSRQWRTEARICAIAGRIRRETRRIAIAARNPAGRKLKEEI